MSRSSSDTRARILDCTWNLLESGDKKVRGSEPSIAASVPKVRCHQEQPSTAAAWTGSSADKVAFRCICAKDRVACFSTSAKNTTGGERIFAAAAGKSAEIREAPFPRRPKRLLSASTQVDFRSSRLVNCC
jgi:hypothetical protein